MRVWLLGPPIVVTDDGRELISLAPKERAVLAWLGLRAGKVVQASELVGALWGEDPPRSATKAVQTYVWSLRRLLPQGSLETSGGGYRLCVGEDDVDVVSFERLVRDGEIALSLGEASRAVGLLGQALELWRGDPLIDLSDQAAGQAEAARLKELREDAREQLMDARLAEGEDGSLVGDLEAAVAAEPLRERRWRQLMLALYRSGRQADALRAYQRLRALLGDELGIEPAKETGALEAAMLAQDPSLLLAPHLTVEGAAPAGQVTVVCAEIDGAELGEIFSAEWQEVIEAAAAAHGGVIAREHGGRLLVVFSEAADALSACVEIQRAPGEPPLVRMGLDSGTDRGSTGGVDAALPGAAGLAAAANGGQVLLSARTASVARRDLPSGITFLDRGEFALVGLTGPERVLQLRHPELRASFPPMRASPALSHSLPDARTSFVGREDALAALDELLSRCPLVAVVGPGGAGKTRLALEAAARAAPRFSAGAELCDLSPLSDPALVPVTIAVSFGIRETSGVDPLDAIARSISGREALLVIDNCEHLLEAAAAAVDSLLSRARGLRVLATSREPLGVSGEQVWRIGPLRIPAAASSSDEARGAESVLLFEDRARLAAPGFSLDDGNALDVAAICRSLEGFPLAIELVAARVGAMSPEVIAARLRDRSQLLATGPRGGSGRHASLEATIDWSYQLLDAPERRLLRTLSVFAGGFSVQAVEAVSDAADPLESLAALVDKSLVVWDRDAARYRLLETIRAFARARLEEEGEQDTAARGHLAWSAAFVEPLAELAWSSREPELYAIVDREIDNLRAALSWAAEHGAADGLHLVGKLRDYWFRRAYLEGRRWCRRLLDAVPYADPVDVGRALETAAFCAVLLGRDLDQAAEEADRAVAILEGAGDERALLHARLHRAYVHADLEACRAEHLEVRTMAAKAGDPLLEAAALMNLAAKEAELGGDPAFAAECSEQALAILAGIDCPPTAHAAALQMLGSAILDSGKPLSEALGYFGEAQDYVAQLRSPGLLADNLFSLATCLVEPDPESAARLLGASLGLLDRLGTVLRPPDAAEVDRVRSVLEDQLGDELVESVVGSSSRISFDEAVDLGRLAIKTLPVSRS